MDNDNTAELRGQIERITFTNEENGFTIARVKVYGRKELVTVVGNIVNPTPGEILSMTGEWGRHPKFGEQFKIVSCQTAVPATVHGIEKYLGSGLVKGIGPVMAKRIVKRFKEETLNVIERDIGQLCEIPGIGPKRIAMIKKAWDEQKEVRAIMIFLQSHGVGSGYAARIYKHYGNEAIDVVRENPYRLATDVFGIGFVTADRIAEKLGFARDSKLRAEAGILYVLQQLSDEGHVYYPYEPLLAKCKEILDIDREIIARAVALLAEEKKIIIEDLNRDPAATKAVYLAGYYTAETHLAGRIKALIRTPRAVRNIDAEKDGQPSSTAIADDNNPAGVPVDEDGVKFLTDLIPGRTATVEVTSTVAEARLDERLVPG